MLLATVQPIASSEFESINIECYAQSGHLQNLGDPVVEYSPDGPQSAGDCREYRSTDDDPHTRNIDFDWEVSEELTLHAHKYS